jgi:hypothetical protein
MTCKDSSITYLKSIGYNVVRIPKGDIHPLQMLTKQNGVLKQLGDVASVFAPGGTPVPKIKRNSPVADISGNQTSDLSVGIGLSILGNIIGAMGGSKLGLEAKFEKAKTLSFEFLDVVEDSVAIAMLDKFLGDADVNAAGRYVSQLLEADEVYVITATIKTNKFNVEGKQKNKTAVTVQVPEIKEIIGGNIDVGKKAAKSSKITFQGKISLVFGFQAVQLIYEDGVYSSLKHLKAGQGAVALKNTNPTYLMNEGPFVNVSFLN